MSELAAVLERKKANNTSSAGSILQRKAIRSHSEESVPPIVHEVLRSPGRPLDRETREPMESRFGHDFSQVRMHTDSRAAESAKAVNAVAYTVNQHIVFGSGRYSPNQTQGLKLIAHELVHTIQQNPYYEIPHSLIIKPNMEIAEQEADSNSRSVIRGGQVSIQNRHPTCLQRLILDEEEPAGGCGVCLGPQLAGILAHQQVQSIMRAECELREAEEPGSMIRQLEALGCGRPDLWFGGTRPIQIGEIKPAKPSGIDEGRDQILDYTSCFQSHGINVIPAILPPPIDFMGIFLEPTLPPGCPEQELFVNPPIGGVYSYYCMPTYRQLMRTGQCRCIEPAPQPQEQEQEQESRSRRRSRRLETRPLQELLPAFVLAVLSAAALLALAACFASGVCEAGIIIGAVGTALAAIIIAIFRAEGVEVRGSPQQA